MFNNLFLFISLSTDQVTSIIFIKNKYIKFIKYW